MRKRWVYIDGRAIEVTPGTETAAPSGPLVIGDLPGYVSPVTGQWVEGRVQRREDLLRSGSRPWEGKEQEIKENARQRAYEEQKFDARIHETAARAFYQLPPSKRRALTGRG